MTNAIRPRIWLVKTVFVSAKKPRCFGTINLHLVVKIKYFYNSFNFINIEYLYRCNNSVQVFLLKCIVVHKVDNLLKVFFISYRDIF